MSERDGQLPESSEGRCTRNRKDVNYKKMHEGTLTDSEGDTEYESSHDMGQAEGSVQYEVYDDADDELERMRKEIKALDKEKALLQKSEEIRKVRAELESKRKEVTKLRGTGQTGTIEVTNTKRKSKAKTAENKIDDININTLRQDEELRKLVRKELETFGLGSNQGSILSSSSLSSNSSSTSLSEERKTAKNKDKKKKKHKLKSGITAKASDRVKHPQKWPQAHLQYEHVSKQVQFKDLDFKLFIAGELEIISEDGLPESERIGRMKLLKKIIYFSNTYSFEGLKEFYAAWVREIEMGLKTWLDSTHELESAVLGKHVKPQKSFGFKSGFKKDTHPSSKQNQSSDEEKIWFCSLYQKNKCSNRANHMVVYKGKMRRAMHICATCWLKDKQKLEHPESSTACPHAIA